MSGIYLPGMEMPGSCNHCIFDTWGLCLINSNLEGKDELTHSCPLVPAADAIEELQKDLEREMEYKNYWQEEALKAKARIEELQGQIDGWIEQEQKSLLKSMPRWISVKERLPLRGDSVLCVGDNGISVADFVCGDKWCATPWFYVDGEQETGVTHWMPRPEPPKEDEA